MHLEWHWCTKPGSWMRWWSNLTRLSVFSCRWQRVVGRAARVSVKWRSSSWEKSDECPLGLSAVVLRMIQSMPTRKRIGRMTNPCCTPDSTETRLKGFYLQWHCTQTVSRTTPWLWPSLDRLRMIAKPSTGCRGARYQKLSRSHCSMMFVNDCVNSAEKNLIR